MRLMGRENLQALYLDETARGWVACWVDEVAHAHWKRPRDVNEQFPKSRQQGDGSFIFLLPDGTRAIVASFHFSLGIALIQKTVHTDQS